MTILEAMSCEKPLLLRDLDLYEDILFHYYQKASSNDGFLTVIDRLQKDTTFYKKSR